jgi:hypothetical protein
MRYTSSFSRKGVEHRIITGTGRFISRYLAIVKIKIKIV